MWSEAALTPFILRHGAGIAVSSLRETGERLKAVTPEQYRAMCENAMRLGRLLQEGHFFLEAYKKAEPML